MGMATKCLSHPMVICVVRNMRVVGHNGIRNVQKLADDNTIQLERAAADIRRECKWIIRRRNEIGIEFLNQLDANITGSSDQWCPSTFLKALQNRSVHKIR
ncbi:hypothetical protein U1Q18_032561 [Sarracenia purpurea var. burkii]